MFRHKASSSSKAKKSSIRTENSYNEIIPGSQQAGHSAIYRKRGLEKLIETIEPGMHTVRDLLERTVDKYGHKNGFGTFLITF